MIRRPFYDAVPSTNGGFRTIGNWGKALSLEPE
jgi:hypothetical protein